MPSWQPCPAECSTTSVSDRLTHSLQTATRVEQAGRDDEYVFCALLHDIGDLLASLNHADLAAAVVKPFVSEQNFFMVAEHALFQGYYFWHFVGLDRDARDTLPLEHFEPLLRAQLAR